MPVSKPQLKSQVQSFTRKDFENGKCTKDGLPLPEKKKVTPVTVEKKNSANNKFAQGWSGTKTK